MHIVVTEAGLIQNSGKLAIGGGIFGAKLKDQKRFQGRRRFAFQTQSAS